MPLQDSGALGNKDLHVCLFIANTILVCINTILFCFDYFEARFYYAVMAGLELTI